jgi:hypothetical protein
MRKNLNFNCSLKRVHIRFVKCGKKFEVISNNFDILWSQIPPITNLALTFLQLGLVSVINTAGKIIKILLFSKLIWICYFQNVLFIVLMLLMDNNVGR